MATIKKLIQDAPRMRGSLPKKAKAGVSFPDLNKDGKITKADVLKGRGVIAKKGATVKAKDGNWIQKAVNPKHKGYCTPMTKATCTPKRKALAKTFKKMGAERKAKSNK